MSDDLITLPGFDAASLAARQARHSAIKDAMDTMTPEQASLAQLFLGSLRDLEGFGHCETCPRTTAEAILAHTGPDAKPHERHQAQQHLNVSALMLTIAGKHIEQYLADLEASGLDADLLLQCKTLGITTRRAARALLAHLAAERGLDAATLPAPIPLTFPFIIGDDTTFSGEE